MWFSHVLAFIGLLATCTQTAAQVRDVVESASRGRTLQQCDDTFDPWTMQEVENYSQESACLVVLYNVVYNLTAFANIHRGGSFSIARNCGKDATDAFASLVCIAGVPDHNRGILNMVADDIVGVVEGTGTDPCPPPIITPSIGDYNGDCTLFDVVQCDDLRDMPKRGRWTMEEVADTDDDQGCLVSLYDYVFDLGRPPQRHRFTPHDAGDLTFLEKHGGGAEAILCKTNVTDSFEAIVNRTGVPDHTRGSMNALLAYLVGVIEESDVDPCVTPTVEPDCSDLIYYTRDEVEGAFVAPFCLTIILGKVYDLQKFASLHYGGRDAILKHCRDDITEEFFGKDIHKLVHLATIRQFQVGVIQDDIADPCGREYDPFPDITKYQDSKDKESDDSDDESSDSSSSDDDNEGYDFTTIDFCFPGEAFVDVDGKGLVALQDLHIGDQVQVSGGRYESIYSFAHKDPEAEATYLSISTHSGANIEISKDHLLFVHGRSDPLPASLVRRGDKLYTSASTRKDVVELDPVESIQVVVRKGAFAPLTPSGTIVVNGIKASTFVALQDSPHLFIGGVVTGLSFHWMEHTFELPHRVWCSYVYSCDKEEYINGISFWLDSPYKLTRWFLGQSPTAMTLFIIPLCLWLGLLGFLDFTATHFTSFLFIVTFVVAACVSVKFSLRIQTSRRSDSNNKKQS